MSLSNELRRNLKANLAAESDLAPAPSTEETTPSAPPAEVGSTATTELLTTEVVDEPTEVVVVDNPLQWGGDENDLTQLMGTRIWFADE